MNVKNRYTLIVLLLICMFALLVTGVFAVHDLAFQLDGDISPVDQNPGSPGTPAFDWANFFNSSGVPTPALPDASRPGFVASTFSQDFVPGASGPDRTTFTTGSKDILNITPGWQCARSNNVNDKIDLLNVYATAYVDPITGHTVVYFALERFSNDGDANVAFWFLQDPTVGCLAPASGPSTTSFTGNHVDGDLLVVSAFTKGGVVSTVDVYRWNGGAGGSLGTTPIPGGHGVDCKSSAAGDFVCATVNGPAGFNPPPWPNLTPPWPTADKDGDNVLNVSEFYEGGLDLTALGLGGRCFNKFLADTRSSQSLTATLFDFAGGDFSLCKMKVTKTGDTLSKVGDDVNYTITIENNGGVRLYKDDITDSLLGNITLNGVNQANPLITSNTCGTSLAPGASCTITATRTVQAGDPDPLPNTVTVVYNADPGLLGDSVTRTASHSVNLFQPSVSIDKTGDTLSKVGDGVNYTITVKNTSSADSPNLTCTITDALLGINKSVNLAPGGSDVTNASRTVQGGDLDPLVNTASVDCTVDGFGNKLHAEDSHSVNLFQPSLTIDKTGDTLSKVGDDVNYTIKVCNTSSGDSPNLVKDSVTDSLISGVNAAFGASLTPGQCESHDFTRTVQAGDPDPLDNTATAHYHPDGFPNDIKGSDDHEVNLFQPSVKIEKTSDTLSKVGDDVNYTIKVTNTSSGDSPNLTCAITDALLGINKNVNLAPGDVDTTNATYTVQAGDDDPLKNTASVDCTVDGFGNKLSASVDNYVNLFQPSVDVEKTGDTLSKAGDDVNYTITVTNTSSGDSPDLVNGTITDDVLGDLLDPANPYVTFSDCITTLATGGSCTINATRTVQAGDPDPLKNTVTVHYNPDGFPNDITDSDSHEVDLVHPGLTVSKTCAPTTARPGDTITYTCTISNTGDVQLNRISIFDSLKGDLTDPANFTSSTCDPTLAAGASCTITYTFTAPSGTPTLVNTVTATYQVQGLPNVLAPSSSCTVTIPTEGCTPGFWKNHTERWDQNSDAVSVNVKAAVDAEGSPYFYDVNVDGVDQQLFKNIFGLTDAQMTAAGLSTSLTMEQAINLGGGGFEKLARHGVAALLSSASGINYPYTSQQVLESVHSAIVNLQAEPTAQQLADANNLTCPLT